MDSSTRLNSHEVYVDDKMAKGFEVTYTCKKNFKQTETKSTCDREGKWSPTVVCYPGMSSYKSMIFNIVININLF